MSFLHLPFKISEDKKQKFIRSVRRGVFLVVWGGKKFLIFFARSHLSHVLALGLAIFAVGREVIEHYGWNKQLDESGWKLFIVILSVVTILAAVWEFFGNKIATTEQEVRFITGMNSLVESFNIFERKIRKNISKSTAITYLQEFLDDSLKISSGVLCGKHDVDVALMFYNKHTGELILNKSNIYQPEPRGGIIYRYLVKPLNYLWYGKYNYLRDLLVYLWDGKYNYLRNPLMYLWYGKYNYLRDLLVYLWDGKYNYLRICITKPPLDKFKLPENLEIPLDVKDESQIGPAATVFRIFLTEEEKSGKQDPEEEKKKKHVAHLPKKHKKIGVILKKESVDNYQLEGFFSGWYSTPTGENQNFRSVLSVPILSYVDDKNNEILGILNFTTRKRDLFIDRDYIIADTFASFLAQAIVLNRNRLSELDQNPPQLDEQP